MNQPASRVYVELLVRWRAIFTALNCGSDLPPAQRLRTEGLMEAVAMIDELTPEKLQQQMDTIYREVFGRNLEQDFGSQWQDFFPFPQIPAMGKRAPVYPSTPE